MASNDEHTAEEAELAERDEGAHEEQIGTQANLEPGDDERAAAVAAKREGRPVGPAEPEPAPVPERGGDADAHPGGEASDHSGEVDQVEGG